MDVAAIDTATYDLSVKNPNGGEEVALRTPQDILDEIAALDADGSGLGSEFVVRLPAPPNEPDSAALSPLEQTHCHLP